MNLDAVVEKVFIGQLRAREHVDVMALGTEPDRGPVNRVGKTAREVALGDVFGCGESDPHERSGATAGWGTSARRRTRVPPSRTDRIHAPGATERASRASSS